ncbi:TMEM175 family protein [Lactobacillus gigeriorum]|uniref:Integral membrane protein n=1 Tax=Lactobacillus gigeriorum DSM 23908 = CRBIP 24.85 TaxID=1423751 RepID=I7K232_9LACO|nr:TMEM175 family protein [Lactobacillus gigeriorum]KRN14593.1 hypothetical protein FC38_GL000676 [Lactobacillus gigeriorum DSM 23908 = CRBIP 24.85]CCI87810.1 Integral membrane protein [Lactobacillus gigeriorum DSM 23908 = CRBIP 24.85]
MINKSRLEALSDAIIAILMTIMALQIEVPTGIKLSSLKNPIIYFIAYIVSFTIAMAFWYNYHCLFAKVTNISKRVFWLM